MTRATPLCLLATLLIACGGVERWPLLAQRVDRGPPPPARGTLHGSRIFVIFEGAVLTSKLAILAGVPWPAEARSPRSVEANAECASGPGPTQHIEYPALLPGERFYISLEWSKLCPREPEPKRAKLSLQLIDMCAAGQCETLSGTLEVESSPEPWPSYDGRTPPHRF